MNTLKILILSLKLMTTQLFYGLAKRLFPQPTYGKALYESDGHIMKLVNCDTTENLECVSIWEQHSKWNVSVSGSNITSRMCQYLGAT